MQRLDCIQKQWVNLDGAPTTLSFTANSGIRNRPIGLGMVMSMETIGVHSDFSFYFSYAYRIRWKDGALSMGLQAGFTQLKSDFTRLTLNSINDPNLSGMISKLRPNFGTGLFYERKNFYAGFSIPYLLNSKYFEGEDVQFSDARSRRYYFFVLAKIFEINRRLQLKPETMIRFQEGAPLGIDLNLKFILDQRIGLGAFYRSGDALITTFEFQLNDNLRLGYAYEWTLSNLAQYSRGTHEFMINYRFRIRGLSRPDYCATYF
ncbi:MAG: type IX secretion system membrane protein PorP/SprF [Cyclobacteriaceae bacterium]|nr:type IX secretion system membrane protein PorP/SprF [Cyclobacteriaceae bacterium]